MEDNNVIYRALVTPDGTILQSRHFHDHQSHTDANGKLYSIDGGPAEFVWIMNHEDAPAKSIIIFDDDPIELIREYWSWGTIGVNGDEPLRFILLKDLSDDHIEKILEMYYTHPIIDREQEYRNEAKV